MAQEAPIIQNKRLLFVAMVLAGIVVAIYNFHVNHVRKSSRGEMVTVLSFTRDMSVGEEITSQDIRSVEIPISDEFQQSLRTIAQASQRGEVVGWTLNHQVQKNQMVQWSFLIEHGRNQPRSLPRGGMVGFTLKIDPELAPGDILRQKGRISVRGLLPDAAGKLTSHYIIRGVKVLAIGGIGQKDTSVISRSRGDEAQRVYRSVVVEVSPQVAVGLDNVISHVRGSVRIDVLNPNETFPANPQVADEVGSFAEWAAGS